MNHVFKDITEDFRRNDIASLSNMINGLSPIDHLNFITWLSDTNQTEIYYPIMAVHFAHRTTANELINKPNSYVPFVPGDTILWDDLIIGTVISNDGHVGLVNSDGEITEWEWNFEGVECIRIKDTDL